MTDFVPLSPELQRELLLTRLEWFNNGEPGWLDNLEVTDEGFMMAWAWVAGHIEEGSAQAHMATVVFMLLAKIALERGLIEGEDG